MKPTVPQRETMRAIYAARGEWYRAASNGQRVTLANLYRLGLLERRVWREGKNAADNAHEYRLATKRTP